MNQSLMLFTPPQVSVVEARLRNLTLDSSTWQDSPSVDREWFVPAAEFGIKIGTPFFQACFSYIFWGREFEGQLENSKFGALTFSYFFCPKGEHTD